MENPQKGKDFLTWWRQDVAPAVSATRRSLEPHIRQWQQYAVAINKAFNEFIEEHRESIELWAQVAKVYPQLEPYLNNITSGLSDPEFDVANDVIELAHIFEAIDLQKDPGSNTLLDIISNQTFQKSLLDLYASLTLDQNRVPLITEALELHNKKYFAGSVCLLYGLIEGVLTESFEKANYLLINQKNIDAIGPNGVIDKKKKLTGLVPKLDHAITHQDQLQSYYGRIKIYELVAGDPDQTIPKTRNEILHGNSLNFNTEKRSAQLILWFYSTILHVRVLGI